MKRTFGSLTALMLLLAALALAGCGKDDSHGSGGHDMQHMNMEHPHLR